MEGIPFRPLAQLAKRGLPALMSRGRTSILPELEAATANYSYTSHNSFPLGTEADEPEISAGPAPLPNPKKPLECSSSEELTTFTVVLSFTDTTLTGTFTAAVSLVSAEGGAHTSSSVGLVTQSTSVFQSVPAFTTVVPTASSKPTSTSDSETDISIILIGTDTKMTSSTFETIPLSTLVVAQLAVPSVSEGDPFDDLAELSNSLGTSVTLSKGTATTATENPSISALPTLTLSRGEGARRDGHNWMVSCGLALAALL
ncbi:MAG: hypothetical protein Q9160_000470 [Pyrenula sp. 1 TL-2023]